jgi:hypothetical protein
MIRERREARAKNENVRYEGIVTEMIQREQVMTTMKLTEILRKLEISEIDFKQSAKFHSEDPSKKS